MLALQAGNNRISRCNATCAAAETRCTQPLGSKLERASMRSCTTGSKTPAKSYAVCGPWIGERVGSKVKEPNHCRVPRGNALAQGRSCNGPLSPTRLALRSVPQQRAARGSATKLADLVSSMRLPQQQGNVRRETLVRATRRTHCTFAAAAWSVTIGSKATAQAQCRALLDSLRTTVRDSSSANKTRPLASPRRFALQPLQLSALEL
jgi:hypothetical protein